MRSSNIASKSSPHSPQPKKTPIQQRRPNTTKKKINIQKSIAFLYTINEISERDNKNKISLKITLKKKKQIGINPTKEVEDLYPKNYKIVLKEIEDDSR